MGPGHRASLLRLNGDPDARYARQFRSFRWHRKTHRTVNLGDDRAMKPLPASHLRIARPSHDLRASERFWVGGLGLEVLFRADSSAEGGHALLMVGWPGAGWH